MSTLLEHLEPLLGLGREAAGLTFLQISLRGVLVFATTLIIVRCGDRRFLSQKTAFDAVLGFILASMLARAATARPRSSRRSGAASCWSPASKSWRTGRVDRMRSAVNQGAERRDRERWALDEAGARRNRLSEHDVLEDLRLNGNVGEIRDVLLAVLERNGQVSVVRRARQ